MERKTQFILDAAGDPDLAVMPIEEYRLLTEALEDAEDIADGLKGLVEIRTGLGVPANVADAVVDGVHPIRAWRKHRGLTAAKLANAAGLSPAYVTQIETGRRDGSLSAIRKLAGALGVEPGDLI